MKTLQIIVSNSLWDKPTNRPLVRLDMSEFMESHSVSKLIGSPPGYVGYQEAGQLTEAIRRNANAVILLDEIEKAHPDVYRLFLQVAEDGRLTDSKGRVVDCKDTVIIMTSNIGSSERRQQGIGFLAHEGDSKSSAVNEERTRSDLQTILLKGGFAPEFINRIDSIAQFRQLNAHDMSHIVELELNRLEKAAENIGIKLSFGESVKETIGKACLEDPSGARAVRRVIQQRIENPLSELILRGEASTSTPVEVSLGKEAFIFSAKQPKEEALPLPKNNPLSSLP